MRIYVDRDVNLYKLFRFTSTEDNGEAIRFFIKFAIHKTTCKTKWKVLTNGLEMTRESFWNILC